MDAVQSVRKRGARTTKSKSLTIDEQIETLKSELAMLDSALGWCWQAKQGSKAKVAVTTEKGTFRLTVSPFDAASQAAEAWLGYAQKPVKSLYHDILFTKEGKSETAAQIIREGYRHMCEAKQAVFTGDRQELLQLLNAVKKFIAVLDTIQIHFGRATNSNSDNKVDFDENSPDFIENKNVVKMAHKASTDHDMDDLKKHWRNSCNKSYQ